MAKFCWHCFSCLWRQWNVIERLNHNNDKMNTQLYRIKCYSSCFFFSFLSQNCSGFTIEILIIIMKSAFLFSFLFLFFLYATMTLVYVMIEIFQKIQFISISFWWLVPPLFFKIVFHSVKLRIPLISSLRNIYLCHAVFNF